MYYAQGPMSQKLRNIIMYYYKELYDAYEVKTVPEIAAELNVDKKTINKFINLYYQSPNLEGNYNALTTMIMLCTKFNSTSQYYEEQQEHFGELIKKRAILKQLKLRIQNSNSKINSKRL